jgi:glutathione synthase/RimK-type ligase-like ATP-grasp enzyme
MVPFWGEILQRAKRVSRAVGLGYIGVDIVIDAEHGPMLLEANARPGLAIQIANAQGLKPLLDDIDSDRSSQEIAANSLRKRSLPRRGNKT